MWEVEHITLEVREQRTEYGKYVGEQLCKHLLKLKQRKLHS